MVAKIRLWKVIALSIITLGIYQIVWFARRRNEIVKQYKVSIPHWLWLVAPSIIMCLLAIPLVFIFADTNLNQALLLLIFSALVIIAIAAYGISIWWMCVFGQITEKLTQGKVTFIWTILYWLLLALD